MKTMIAVFLLAFFFLFTGAQANLICNEELQIVDLNSIPDSLVLPLHGINFQEWSPENEQKFQEIFPENLLRTEVEINKIQRYTKLKKILDRSIVVLTLPITLPVALTAALVIKLSSKGPVFFTQMRMGYRGKPFRILKLRTMYERESGGNLQTQVNDPRIFPAARFLRKYHLDELPQLINIFRGEMSLVGPRPEGMSTEESRLATTPGYGLRFQAVPGLTGKTQLQRPYDTAEEKLASDLYYAKRVSLKNDLAAILLTLLEVPKGKVAR